jgi:hypothetical protein
MEELDKESSVLYAQLGNLEADLRQETSNFDQAKSYELEGLLASQNTLQRYFIVGLFYYICSFLLFVWLFFFTYAFWL